MGSSNPYVRNVYFKDKKLFHEFMGYCKKKRLTFSHTAREAFRMFLEVKRQEEEAIKKANIKAK